MPHLLFGRFPFPRLSLKPFFQETISSKFEVSPQKNCHCSIIWNRLEPNSRKKHIFTSLRLNGETVSQLWETYISLASAKLFQGEITQYVVEHHEVYDFQMLNP